MFWQGGAEFLCMCNRATTSWSLHAVCLQVEGMQRLWDVLMDRTHDPELLCLVKRLLAWDVNERCTVCEALADPYLAGVDGQAPPDWWEHGVPMPQPAPAVLASAHLLPGSLLPEMGSCEGLHMIPGLHNVTWRPDAPPFCCCETGPIHRFDIWPVPHFVMLDRL